MKTKLFKRVSALLLACIMLIGVSATAFAAEVPEENEMEICDEMQLRAEPRAYSAEADIPAFGTVKLYLDKPLEAVSTLHVSTFSSGRQGAIIVTAVNSNALDVELSDDWVIGTTDEASWKLITLGGTIIVTVSNHSSSQVHVKVWM